MNKEDVRISSRTLNKACPLAIHFATADETEHKKIWIISL